VFNRQLWIPCRDSVATGAAIGAFFAVLPMPGQSIAAALATMKCRGNVPFAVGVCFLSNPFTNIPIWSGQLWLGNLIQKYIPVPMPPILGKMETALPGLGKVNAGGFIVGSVASGCLLAILAFLIAHCFAALLPGHLPARRRERRLKPDPSSHATSDP
jgi:uncharacterized protein (DUF2062 family)